MASEQFHHGRRAEAPRGGGNVDLAFRMNRTAGWLALGTLALGSLVLVGWTANVDALKTVRPGLASMKPNTALCFLLGGISLWIRHSPRASVEWMRPFAGIGAALVVAVSGLTLVEYAAGVNLGLDEVLFHDDAIVLSAVAPGRMAVATAVAFSLVGVALMSIDVETKRVGRPAQWIALLGTALTLLAIVGYLYGLNGLYEIPAFASVAVHTALGLFGLNVGILLARPEAGLMAPLTANGSAAVFARRMLPAVIVVPIVLGWLRLMGQRLGFYGTEFGLSLHAVANIVCLVGLTWWTSFSLVRLETVRSESQELEALNRRIQEGSRLKSEFLANMSHELRTPLNAIIGFAELMHRGKVGAVSTDQEEYLGDILTSSKHLLQLINDVLDLAKVESGKMEFRPESVDLAKLAREVCDILRGLAASERLQVDTHVDSEVATVVVDPARVKQILYNYLSNAIKFTPAGGRITIRILPEGPALFRIDVEDTGVGIAADDLGKLFVEFQQLDASAAKEYQGTGLGLALTKKLAEAHGGHVAVRSTPGEGSTFSVILPRVMTMAPADEVAGSVMGVLAGNRTILVVDDDPAALKMASLALREMGYRPVCCADPEDALRKAESDPPGIVIVDLLMPGVDGFEFVSRFRALPAGRDVPIIVWTVKDLDADERRRLQPSITGLVSKNAGGSHALVEQLRRLLPHPSTSEAADGA
jgi:signal transduction histidine kinase/CheY-like chemotaxis protein